MAAARDEWAAQFKTPEDVRAYVFGILDRRAETIVAKMLGFDNHFNGWEVDHCNGRAGESAAGNYLRRRVGNAVGEWLDKVGADIPPPPKACSAALRKAYADEYAGTAEREIRSRARAAALADVNRLASEALGAPVTETIEDDED